MNTLAQFVDDYLHHNHIKKVYVASMLGLTKQRLNQILNKKSFNVDDANYILNAIGHKLTYKIELL